MSEDRVESWRTPTFDRFVRWTQWPLLALALLMIPVLVIPEVAHTGRDEGRAFAVLDWSIYAVFVAEYLVRLRLAADRRAFVRGNLFDLALVLIPFLRPLRVARVVRLLRVARLGALLGSSTKHARGSMRNQAIAYVGVVAGALTLLCSVLMLDVERHNPKANIHTYGDSIWWAITTLSTVGYGDRFPVTWPGRGIALVLMLAGVSLFGTITAAVASFFVQHLEPEAPPADDDLPSRLARLEEAVARIEAAVTSQHV